VGDGAGEAGATLGPGSHKRAAAAVARATALSHRPHPVPIVPSALSPLFLFAPLVQDVDLAVETAKKAYPAWSKLTAKARSQYIFKLREAIIANTEELGTKIKPITRTMTEQDALTCEVRWR
jgi:hypothetical protein